MPVRAVHVPGRDPQLFRERRCRRPAGVARGRDRAELLRQRLHDHERVLAGAHEGTEVAERGRSIALQQHVEERIEGRLQAAEELVHRVDTDRARRGHRQLLGGGRDVAQVGADRFDQCFGRIFLDHSAAPFEELHEPVGRLPGLGRIELDHVARAEHLAQLRRSVDDEHGCDPLGGRLRPGGKLLGRVFEIRTRAAYDDEAPAAEQRGRVERVQQALDVFGPHLFDRVALLLPVRAHAPQLERSEVFVAGHDEREGFHARHATPRP